MARSVGDGPEMGPPSLDAGLRKLPRNGEAVGVGSGLPSVAWVRGLVSGQVSLLPQPSTWSSSLSPRAALGV